MFVKSEKDKIKGSNKKMKISSKSENEEDNIKWSLKITLYI